MRILFTFFRLWFSMISECWQDARTINNKELQETFRTLNEEFEQDADNEIKEALNRFIETKTNKEPTKKRY